MSLEVSIDGAATLHRVAARMRAAGQADLSKQMSRALSKALDPVRASIAVEAGEVMPGAYKSLLTGSLRHRVSRRSAGNQARVILATYADGKQQRREIRALEAGALRHPLFGRKKRWYVTRIRPGFHKRGTESAMDAAREGLLQVVKDYADKLIS